MGSKMFPTSTAAGAMLTATLLMDTGIRLKQQGRFMLYTAGDIEGLGMLCHKCEGLAIHLRPFV